MTSIELIFSYFSSLFIFIMYYQQYRNIYKNISVSGEIKDSLNIDVINSQLITLKTNFYGSRIDLYLFPISMIIVSLFMLILDIGGTWKYLFIGSTIFLSLQSFLEYYGLFLNILSKTEEENKSIKEVLYEMETSTKYKELIKEEKEEKQIFIKRTLELAYKSKIIPKYKENTKNTIKYKLDNNFLIETDDRRIFVFNYENENISSEEIIENNSMYWNSFYEFVPSKEVYLKLIMEPSLISLMIISIIYLGDTQ